VTASMSWPGLLIALFLPWCCGAIWVHWLLARSGRWNAWIVLGHGYFLGMFLATLVIRAWDYIGLTLAFTPIAAAVCGVAVAGILLHVLRPAVGSTTTRASADSPVAAWQLGVATLLVGLFAWRYLTLVQELLLRPLYAWDAWMNWAPKAITWFHRGALVDYVSPEQWLQQLDGLAYTLGNKQAWDYPVTVPLVQLWGMLALGTWDSSLVYLPWVFVPVCLGLGVYGHLRLAGVPVLLAVIACYLLLSLPFLNVHTVLAGYADIWVAAAFGMAVCALHAWQQTRHWAYAVLWMALAIFSMQLKNPGIVLGLIVIACGIRGALSLSPLTEMALVVTVLVLLALAVVVGINIDVPLLGRVSLDTTGIEAGSLGEYTFQYHPVGRAFRESFFVSLNWNLLAYLVPLFVLYRLYRLRKLSPPSIELAAILGAAAFLVLAFWFTRYYKAAMNFATVNRALLALAPVLIFHVFLHLDTGPAESPDG